jgi:Fic family protein
MKKLEIGAEIEQTAGFRAFIPHKFPPSTGFPLPPEILKKGIEATRLLGKLDGITLLLPNVDYFLKMYIRKDAAASNQIEGTKATLIDAIEAGAKLSTKIPDDVDDILHYIDALNYGMKRVKEENFPMSLRFIRELHKELMEKARSTHFSNPGEFRNSQNWIGGTRPDNARYVPPPVEAMHNALNDLELFLHADDAIPTVIKAGLLHSQFETIHPFLDGNGRTGRMLITFYLWKERLLEKPVLFLSSYFIKHQDLYYEKLRGYHHGEVYEWLEFFLDGVIEISQQAIGTIEKITRLREKHMAKIQSFGKRAAESAMLVLPKLYEQPIINVGLIQVWTGFSRPGAQIVIDRFVGSKILNPKNEDTKYGQSYVYKEYVNIFTDKP